jgi:hypothetical protein
MGNEFMRKQRESRAKGWNRQLRAGAQDMFVSLAPGQELGCRASVHHGEMPQVGRKLMLQLSGDAILVRDENVCIGEVNQPKPELLHDLQRGAGLAVAQVRSQLKAASCIDLVVER